MSGDSIIPDVIFFASFTLLISLLIKDLKKKFKIPITIMMVISGCMLRYITQFLPNQFNAYKLADNIDNHFLLFVFIPPLIFETAISLEWYTFKRQFFQILLLATTGVFITTLLIALVSGLVFLDHKYSTGVLLAFGVILSATDHVSVVAQLHEHHVEHRLSTLIQGETLLNDASVLVILTLVIESHHPNINTLGIGAEHFLQLTLGGFAIGCVFSLLMILYLKKMINEPIQEVNITIVATYLAFYFADGASLHFSGAIAVATIGLSMSAFGKTVVSPNSESAMHSIWALLSCNIESLIFLISGMLFAKDVLIDERLGWDHYLRYIAVFLLSYICRAITMAIHYPLLKRLGYGLRIKEFITLCFSGLKGSITIILALLTRTSGLGSDDENAFIVVGSLMITMLSIITDTFLLSKIVTFFELGKISIVQESLLVQVTAALVQETYQEIQKLSESENGKLSEWELVHKVAGSKKLINALFSSSKVGQKILKDYEDSQNESEFELINAFANEVQLDPDQILTELRRRFLTMMKGIYWHSFEKGQCFRSTLLNCGQAANISLDSEDMPLKTWKELRNLILSKTQLKILKLGSKVPGIKNLCKKLLYNKLALAYDSANCFMHAHHEASHFLKSMPIYFDDYQYHIFTILQESYEEVEACKKYIIQHITSSYPEILRYVQTYRSCHSVFNVQRKLIEKLMHHGLINDIEYENLGKLLDKNVKKVELSYVPKMPDTYDMLRGVFPNVSEELCRNLAKNTCEVFFNEGDFLFKNDDSAQGAYIILRGCAREFTDNFDEKHAIGSISGVQHLIPSFGSTITSSQATTTTIALKIRMNNIEITPEFEKEVWIQAASKIFMIYKHDFSLLLDGMSYESICKFTSDCDYARYKLGETVGVKSGGLLLLGKLDIFNAYQFIPPDSYEELICNEDAVFMHLSKKLVQYMKANNTSCNIAINSYMTNDAITYDMILPHSVISTNEQIPDTNYRFRAISSDLISLKSMAKSKYKIYKDNQDLSSTLLSQVSINS